jgi:hypothetical protein
LGGHRNPFCAGRGVRAKPFGTRAETPPEAKGGPHKIHIIFLDYTKGGRTLKTFTPNWRFKGGRLINCPFMQTPAEDNSEMFDPRKMLSIVERLKAKSRMPTMEKLDAVLREFRKEYQDKVRQARAAARAEKRRQGALEESVLMQQDQLREL